MAGLAFGGLGLGCHGDVDFRSSILLNLHRKPWGEKLQEKALYCFVFVKSTDAKVWSAVRTMNMRQNTGLNLFPPRHMESFLRYGETSTI